MDINIEVRSIICHCHLSHVNGKAKAPSKLAQNAFYTFNLKLFGHLPVLK